MTRPSLPATGPGDEWGAQLNAGINDVSDRTDLALDGTLIPFSGLSGANDDAKLADGWAAIQTPALKGRTIKLDDNRDYSFTQQLDAGTGFSLMGTYRPQDQPRGSKPIGNQVILRMAGGAKGWLRFPASGNTFGVSVTNISVDGDINSSLVEGNESTSGVLWTSVFRDIGIQNMRSVFGSKSNKLLVTAFNVDGWWNINNVREVAWNLGGSDIWFTPSMMLLDSPQTLLADNEWLARMDYLSNMWTKNVYCTAEGHGGLLYTGSNNSSHSQWLEDSVVEGRNEGAPCKGALVRLQGGQLIITNTRLAHAMSNPSATGRNDAGVIHQTSGQLMLDKVTYSRATGVAESVPLLYVSGGKAVVRNVVACGTTTNPWTGKPVVKQAIAGLIDADSSVTLTTAVSAAVLNGSASDYSTGFANTGTSVTANKPVNLQDNVLLTAAVVGRNNSGEYTTPPAGWTVQAPSVDNTAPGVVRFYTRKIAAASAEPASYTWAGGASGRHNVVIIQVTGTPASAETDVKGAISTLIGSPDRVIVPSVTTVGDLDLLIAAVQASSTGGLPQTYVPGSSGMTLIGSSVTNTGTSESALSVLIQAAQPVGATGTRSIPTIATVVASTGSGYMIAVKSAG